ncbi:MAG: GNAT family N-acetyltransferase [Zoogloeaceae bacterium]|nr:GNAT family N-acetyltransferase [Zoogloeaceae bacterium]
MSPDRTPLQPFLSPAGIVFFGASPQPGTLGSGLLTNLAESPHKDRLFLVSQKHTEIGGFRCHRQLDEINAPLTLALIATPANTVPGIVEACAQRGIGAAVIYSGGLRPDTPAGEKLTQIAQRYGIRLCGPNALGYILPHSQLNLTPITRTVPAGNLALVSQSASVCANILDWNHNEEFGFSALFATGESEDLSIAEIIDHLASDPNTESILLFLEGLRDARNFLSAVRAAASIKPVIAVKAGKSAVSARIAEAHSGARVDRDDAFDAALRRAGVLRVNAIGDMFSAARALTTPRKPRGNRLAIVSNGGGPAVMAVDQAEELDIALATLSANTCTRLASLFPGSWSPGNPVDVMFSAPTEHFVEAISACLDDPGVDAVLAILTPNTYVDPLAVAQATIDTALQSDKPVFTCWLGEVNARSARAAFAKQRFPTFRTPENAVSAFSFMVNWVHNQALLLETPSALSSYLPPDVAAARGVIENALDEDRQLLSLPEAKAILDAFRIPVTQTMLATSPTEAVSIANHLGYPLAMKAATAANSQKSSGSVRLQLRSAPEVAMAFREMLATEPACTSVLLERQVHKPEGRWLAIGIRQDRLFGPVISLSESGIAPVIYNARSVALPPLNARLVDSMLCVPHVARLLGPLPGKPAIATAPLRDILLRVSEMASELPWLETMEIRSLIADGTDAIAVDARIEIKPLPAERERYAHMAIWPYPAQFELAVNLKGGERCTLRPIRPEDTTALQEFVRHLSSQSKRLRFFSALSELPRHQLARYAQIDYGRDMVIIATCLHEGQAIIVGEARYSILLDRKTCDFAVVIADDMAGKGLGSQLMKQLINAAREQGLKKIRGQVIADNEPMLGLMEALDFMVNLTDDEGVVEVTLRLD